MELKSFIVIFGVIVLGAVIAFSWGCQMNLPSSPKQHPSPYGLSGGWGDTTKVRDDCDCGTCEAYGIVYPVCCDSLYGWHTYDGGCNRLCVGCMTCIQDGQYTDCKMCRNCAAGGPSPEHPYDYGITTTIETTTTTASGWWWGGSWWGSTTTTSGSYTTTTVAVTTTTSGSSWWGTWW
jgi:hypothetical protein